MFYNLTSSPFPPSPTGRRGKFLPLLSGEGS
jgi:hypothetical protein